MKHFYKIVLAIALLGIPVFAQEPPPTQERVVYITTSGNGKRYHLEDCRTLRNSVKAEISIQEAKQRAYTPCGVCKPGE